MEDQGRLCRVGRVARRAHPGWLLCRGHRRRAFKGVARDDPAPRGNPPRPWRDGAAARERRRGAGGGADRLAGAAHDPAARERRQSRHQAAEQGRPADAAGLCRRRLVLGRRRAFRARRRRGLRYGDRDGRRDRRALHGAQGRSRAPRHPLPALCARRLLFSARARRAQALPRNDRIVDPRGRHQRKRRRDIERPQCAVGDDRLCWSSAAGPGSRPTRSAASRSI